MLSIRTQHCTNCGLNGHVFRNCQSPVTSYGLIAVRYGENQTVPSVFSKALHLPSRIDSLEFLLIQRKDSLSFVVFIRGKYNLNEPAYIITLLKGMTSKEQQALLTRSFDQLWHDVWGDSAGSRSHRSEYESSDRKFSQLAGRLPSGFKRIRHAGWSLNGAFQRVGVTPMNPIFIVLSENFKKNRVFDPVIFHWFRIPIPLPKPL